MKFADGATALASIEAPNPPPFALLYRPETTGLDRIEILTGEMSEVERLADLPLTDIPRTEDGPGHEVLTLVPYRQIGERGFVQHDDGEPIITMRVDTQHQLSYDEVYGRLPDEQVNFQAAGFDVGDDDYAKIVRDVIADEIGTGAGSNFVIKRAFQASIAEYSPRTALGLFRRLLAAESGAYWTFVVFTGTRTFLGATPERHVSLDDDIVVMNPISGTYRYPAAGPNLPDVIRFLNDRKEIDELYMVVDEELKMMAGICPAGGHVVGPFLKEMAHLAHTEYLIEGRSSRDVRDILRETLFAPTVTGSPIENACRVIARHEPRGRGYYSGVVALIGRDAEGKRRMDSSIMIRTAEISASGMLKIGVGATLVRHSDPESEVAETWSKARGLLSAFTTPHARQAKNTRPKLGEHPGVRAALARRNEPLAAFWLAELNTRMNPQPGAQVLVIDNEDTFTAMLAVQLRSLGLAVRIVPWHAKPTLDAADVVVLGPGPGDPSDPLDPKMMALRGMVDELLDGDTPFLAVCLSHQILAARIGLPLIRRSRPNQGVQRHIELFGRPQLAGFYNTFAARAEVNTAREKICPGDIEFSLDSSSGELDAMRGPGFASLQFHPESLLTQHGPHILAEFLDSAITSRNVISTISSGPPRRGQSNPHRNTQADQLCREPVVDSALELPR